MRCWVRRWALCAALLAVGMVRDSYGAVESPVFDVPRLENVTIDGDPADWGGQGFHVALPADPDGVVKPPEVLDGSMNLAWDPQGLLVLIRVRAHDFTESGDEAMLFKGDCVELYLSPRRGSSNIVQIVVAPGMDPKHPALRWHFYDQRADTALARLPVAFEAARTVTNDTYVLEARLPWASLALSSELGREVAFQAFISDWDSEGKSFYAAWYPGLGIGRSPTSMHTLRLAGAASPPVLAAARVCGQGDGRLRLYVVGERGLAGKRGILRAGDRELASGAFALRDGRAELLTVFPAPDRRVLESRMEVTVDGARVATVDGPVIPPPGPASNEALFGSRIPRTMALLAASNRHRRNPVRILCYGQSITRGPWITMLEQDLRTRYPWAELTLQERALGGYSAERLVRTAEYDVYPYCADLSIFHVYGGERTGELERLISNFRRYTTAEIMIHTHHPTRPDSGPDSGSDFMRFLGQKYGCEIVELDVEWRQYLLDNGLAPSAMLADGVHFNSEGHQLMAMLMGRHFRLQTAAPLRGWSDTVRTYEAKRMADEGVGDEIVFSGQPWPMGVGDNTSDRRCGAAIGTSPESALRLAFTGNRVDVLTGVVTGRVGSARILIDGRPPSADTRLYTVTRPDTPPNVWWPAIRRIGWKTPWIVEDWTLRIREISADCQEFTFDVEGSKTGPDGNGNSRERFVSRSGRVVLEPRDFSLRESYTVLKSATPAGFEVHWSVVPRFVDVLAPPAVPDPSDRNASLDFAARVHRTIVAHGLVNGPHVLEIVPNGDGPVPIEEIVIHRPPL